MFDRPKSGFSPPIGAWLRGPLRSWAEGYLTGTGREDDLLDDAVVRRVWHEFQAGAADAAPLVWALTIYRAWSDRWMTTGHLTA
jgi:asparagine synthase (glutamine-hydrolysing)